MKPAVFRSRAHLNWIALYRPGQYDTFPTWAEAYAHAYTIARIRRVMTETIKGMDHG